MKVKVIHMNYEFIFTSSLLASSNNKLTPVQQHNV